MRSISRKRPRARRPRDPREQAARPVRMGARARLAGLAARADGECLDLPGQRARGRARSRVWRAPRRDRDRLDLAQRRRRPRFRLCGPGFRWRQCLFTQTTDGRPRPDGRTRSSFGTTIIITWAACLRSGAAHAGLEVTLVTPAAMLSAWTANTLEAVADRQADRSPGYRGCPTPASPGSTDRRRG